MCKFSSKRLVLCQGKVMVVRGASSKGWSSGGRWSWYSATCPFRWWPYSNLIRSSPILDWGRISGIHSMMKGVGSFWSGDVLPEDKKKKKRTLISTIPKFEAWRMLLCSVIKKKKKGEKIKKKENRSKKNNKKNQGKGKVTTGISIQTISGNCLAPSNVIKPSLHENRAKRY